MRNVIVTGVARAEAAVVDALAGLGVATVHEAIGRAGYLGPGLRPIQDGTRVGGTAVTALCWPGDNLMIHAAAEQCQAGDLLVVTTASPSTDGMFGELLATSLAARGVRGLVIEAGVRDVAELRAMGFPVWSAAVSAQGTVKETPGAVNVAVSSAGRSSGLATRSSPTTTEWCACRAATSERRWPPHRPGWPRKSRHARPSPTASWGWTCTGCATSSPRAASSTCRTEPPMSSGDGVRCMLMRGGTSKGAYFLAEDLPEDPAERDDLLLRIMGSPDPRQIDGIGGAHPLTSKVAVISRSARADADVDYLFLQVGVDTATVSDRQNCGNLLAGVGPFAVERGLVDKTPVRIHMVNPGSVATAIFPGADGIVDSDGQTAIAGVPGTAAAVVLAFDDGQQSDGPEGSGGSTPARCCLPAMSATSSTGITVTCVDNGMPVVVVAASELGRTGYETIADLEADAGLATSGCRPCGSRRAS